MNKEIKILIKIMGICTSFVLLGMCLYRFLFEKDYWMITAIMIIICPFIYLIRGIDDDLRWIYNKYPKER